MIRQNAAFLTLIVLVLGACCHNNDIYYAESREVYTYFYYDSTSTWEFEDLNGKRVTLQVGRYKKDFVNLRNHIYSPTYFSTCPPPKSLYFQNQLKIQALTPDTFNLTLGASSEDYPDLNYGWFDSHGSAFGFEKFSRNARDTTRALKDTNLMMTINGVQMDSIRRYRIRYQKVPPNNNSAPVPVISTDIYLAPNVGPVLVRRSDGVEWHLVDYHVMKPKF